MKRTRWLLTLSLCLGLGIANGAWAANPAAGPGSGGKPLTSGPSNFSPLAMERAGVDPGLDWTLETGTYAPYFEADGSTGGRVRLADLRGHWSVLVFSDTRTTFTAFRDLDDTLREMGVNLYGVCPDAREALAPYADRESIRFPLLSDTSREISEAYGMLDAEHDLVRPGMVVLDPLGVVRLARADRPIVPDEIRMLTAQVIAAV